MVPMMTTRQRIRGALAALVAALLLPATLVAQDETFAPPAGDEPRFPVTVILVDRDEPPTILRRASAEPRNVILISARRLDTVELSQAIRALMASEAADPTGALRSDELAIRFSPFAGPRPFGWAAAAVQRLRAAERRAGRGLPAGRSLELWLPVPAAHVSGG
jgi:hypothetical protein